ncbi:hypothetical protein [Comamonas testosteroni]|jgi:hypothetical protein|uniref:hypothetical protein n=1 Tax=Comamonas testosteroni TaxID=285 RepID=UPI0026EFDABA|nr:hypothetical protein [Comamonas testosteroni]
MLSAPMALGLALITAPVALIVLMTASGLDYPPGFAWLFFGAGGAGFLLVLYCLLKGKATD